MSVSNKTTQIIQVLLNILFDCYVSEKEDNRIEIDLCVVW